jgi:nitroreductase
MGYDNQPAAHSRRYGFLTITDPAAMIRLRLRLALDAVRLFRQVAIDGVRHFKYSAATDNRSAVRQGTTQLEAQITKDYHRVEKGLTLPSPKRPFGADVQRRLERDIARYESQADHSPTVVDYGRSALRALDAWNTRGERIDWEQLVKVRSTFAGLRASTAEEFFSSRSSVRNFDPQPVRRSVVSEAVQLALNAPSVCNRQAWGVWYSLDRGTVDSILRHQNGNAGFRSSVPCVLIVTVDARFFAGAAERNQRWVDGGLFAMSLVWALHALGVASCMLNWSMTNDDTRTLRTALGMPDHLDVITMIAVGYPAETSVVARSPRRGIAAVLHEVKRPADGFKK